MRFPLSISKSELKNLILGVIFCLPILLFSQTLQLMPGSGSIPEAELAEWQKLAANHLHPDEDFSKFLLTEARYEEDALILTLMSHLSARDWEPSLVELKKKNLLLHFTCHGEATHKERLFVFRLKIKGLEQDQYKLIIEEMHCDGEDGGKMHAKVLQIKGKSYFE